MERDVRSNVIFMANKSQYIQERSVIWAKTSLKQEFLLNLFFFTSQALQTVQLLDIEALPPPPSPSPPLPPAPKSKRIANHELEDNSPQATCI